MADSIAEEVLVNETNETLSNMSNTTGRQAASTEGLVTAYLLMFLMALFPIFVGSIRSVTYHYNLKKKGEEAEERIRMRDAAIFPIYASGCLFGLYLVFKYLPKDFVNLLLNILFFSVGVTALTRFGSVAVDYISSSSNKLTKYILHFQKKKPDQIKDIFKVDFTAIDVVLFILSVFLVSWNIITKDWIINNLMGIAFCFNAIELISLESFSVGCTLLGGLFLYDIFWVFGTDVMVTVAKSFDAPIKLIIPLDLPENGLNASNFGMLGLGDIVLPGLFIALMCRFDFNHHPSSFRSYFCSSFLAYIIGLLTTIIIMLTFSAAQPALLYLVPACIGAPLFLAVIKGDFSPLWAYEDYPPKKKTKPTSGDADGDAPSGDQVAVQPSTPPHDQ